MRIDELPFVVRRLRRISKESSSNVQQEARASLFPRILFFQFSTPPLYNWMSSKFNFQITDWDFFFTIVTISATGDFENLKFCRGNKMFLEI